MMAVTRASAAAARGRKNMPTANGWPGSSASPCRSASLWNSGAGSWVSTPAPSPELSVAAAPRWATRFSASRASCATSWERSPDARATNPTPQASCSRHGLRSGARAWLQRVFLSGIAYPPVVPDALAKRRPALCERAAVSWIVYTLRSPPAPIRGSRIQIGDGLRRTAHHRFMTTQRDSPGPTKYSRRGINILACSNRSRGAPHQPLHLPERDQQLRHSVVRTPLPQLRHQASHQPQRRLHDAGAEARPPHPEPLELRQGWAGGSRDHVEGARELLGEPPDGLAVAHVGHEQAVGA